MLALRDAQQAHRAYCVTPVVRPQRMARKPRTLRALAAVRAMLATLACAAGLSACGGGTCDNPHPGTAAECGTVACTLCD